MLTDLKVSSFACKYVFYRPEHNARRGLHKTEFWKLEEQMKKMGSFCLVIMVTS